MSTSLTLDSARPGDGKLVLAATGELDLSNIEEFTEALSAAIAEADSGGEALIVDLCGIEYLDSAAVNVLFAHADHIQVVARPFLVRLLDITGLTELVTVTSSPRRTEV